MKIQQWVINKNQKRLDKLWGFSKNPSCSAQILLHFLSLHMYHAYKKNALSLGQEAQQKRTSLSLKERNLDACCGGLFWLSILNCSQSKQYAEILGFCVTFSHFFLAEDKLQLLLVKKYQNTTSSITSLITNECTH